MVCTLGVLMQMAFVAGITARRSVPIVATVPSELARGAADFGLVVWTRADLWPDRRIITSLRRGAAGSVAVELMFRDLARPDVLVYWAPGKEAAGERLPENARLLGALTDRTPLPIPADVRGEAGQFVLYSLAANEVVATSKPFIVQKSGQGE
jgi:hypothetical protein